MKKILLIFSLIAGWNSLSAQNQQLQIDSLKKVLQTQKEDTNKAKLFISLGKEYMKNSEFEKSITYFKEGLSLSEKLNFKSGQGIAFHSMGAAFGRLNNYPEALKSCFAAVKIREETGDKKGMAGTYNNIGLIYDYLGNYPSALSMYFKALKINEEIGNKAWIGANYNNIGMICTSQKQYTEALKNFNNALKIYEELGDRPSQNHPYNNMGIVYSEEGNYPEALKNFKTALQIRMEMGDQYEIGNSLSSIGTMYEKLGNYSEALKNHFASIKIADEIDNKLGKSTTCISIGNIKVKLKEYAEARLYFDTSFAISKEIGSIENIELYYDNLTDLDSAQGNYKQSLQDYKLFIQYRDSLLNDENKKQLVQQQMQYDFDKKEAASKAQQDKKDVLSKAELAKEKLMRNAYAVGGILLLLLSGVLYNRYRLKQRSNKQLAEKNSIITIEKQRSEDLLHNILPQEVAEELKQKGRAEAKQFDQVTVMFTDFKGFTHISEKLSPTELVNEIHSCFKAFDNIISKHNIEKIKTIGDSYMCAGGLPVANTTNATDVVKAAIEIQQFMQQHLQQRKNENKEVFEIRIGIHTGAVVAGIVGVKKFAYDIWGDTVNIASRMESSGEAGKVNISGSTYELLKDKFNCIHRGKIQAKNKGEIDMYFVEKQM